MGALCDRRSFFRALARTGPRPDVTARAVFIGRPPDRFGERGHVAYAAAKAGLPVGSDAQDEIVDLDPYGRVNMVEPGGPSPRWPCRA